MAEPDEVVVFYSSQEQPRILDFYRDAITYLKESDIETRVVDIAEDVEEAQEYDLVSTPAVVVVEGGEARTFLGVVDGLRDVMEEDLYGQTVLHEIGVKRGREDASERELRGAGEDEVAAALDDRFGAAVDDLEVTAFDPDEPRAAVEVDPGDELEGVEIDHDQLGAFLSGFFTEVFGSGYQAVHAACAFEGSEACRYEIHPPEE